MKKIVKRVSIIAGCVILGILLIGTITIYSVWHNEINTAFSFQKLRDRNDAHKDRFNKDDSCDIFAKNVSVFVVVLGICLRIN